MNWLLDSVPGFALALMGGYALGFGLAALAIHMIEKGKK